MGKGMWGKGKGMSGVGMGAAGRGCKRKHSATQSPSPKRHAKPFHTMHHAEGMVECVNQTSAVGIKIRRFIDVGSAHLSVPQGLPV